jgi:hypothetical protein
VPLSPGDRVAVVSPSSAGPARFPLVHERAMTRLRAFALYNPAAMLVFDVDLGPTDPQWVLPYGGLLTVDGPGRRVVAHY